MRPSLMKLTRSAPPVSMLDQVPATVVCTGWVAPASARKNAAVITTPVMARIDRNVVLVRRGGLVDWFNMLVIRFVLSLFLLFVFCQAVCARRVNCSPVPTTKPWRGYKECETVLEPGLGDWGKGN